MYHKTTPDQLQFIDFYLPFGGKMDKNNRWVKLAEIIPWETVEKHYQEQLADTGMGIRVNLRCFVLQWVYKFDGVTNLIIIKSGSFLVAAIFLQGLPHWI